MTRGHARKRVAWGVVFGLAGLCWMPATYLRGQAAQSVPGLVTQPVNDAQRVELEGNIHPLARPEFDNGLGPDSLALNRMLLVLKRSPQEEAALDRMLLGQQDKASGDYHHWLTPEEFGAKFGPADSDFQAVTDWLASQGFEVSGVSKGRTVIEFSGTAGLVRQALGAEIHQYVINGESYWANATNPRIPAALAPVIAGIASLNNFPRQPMYRTVGEFSKTQKTGKVNALYTISCPPGYQCNPATFYALGPTDFATIYNVLPLWNTGTDGTGETIAIVADSNIKTQDVVNFRNIFGLPAYSSNCPNASPCLNVILDGPDPGVIPRPETEADLDTEWAGAVAKNATIDLVVSEDTETTAGVDLSALYIIDNDLAPVLSMSYMECERDLGDGGNALENTMWEQAAAEGITVVVGTGDTGSAACENMAPETAAQYGLAVSGNASTPFNVAVGGTDFDNPSSFFNSTNNATTQASAQSYVPEITWNDSCARAGQTTGCTTVNSRGRDLVAGGGGASNCAAQGASGSCTSGYSKPAWQTGSGVPQDGARDIPDVSLFSGDGLNAAFYIVCASDETQDITGSGPASCTSNLSTFDFLGIGGTSVATPAFAGIMALVDQKTGQRQGNANFVLYPLAAEAGSLSEYCASNAAAAGNGSCIFYDTVNGHNALNAIVTPGNNSVACAGGTPNCSAPAGSSDGIIIDPNNSTPTAAWTTNTGYDRATGLGSVNAANLVSHWGDVSFHASNTSLALTPTAITHGQSVTANITVTSSSGTPTGDVALMGTSASATSAASAKFGIATFALSGGSFSGQTTSLPGGTYKVFAHYQGDGTDGASDSSPVQVTLNPENSQTKITFVDLNGMNNVTGTSSGPPTPYGSSFYILRLDVLNSAGLPCAPTTTQTTSSGSFPVQGAPTSGCPTGTVSLTDNGNPLKDFMGSSSAKLNSQGYAEDQPIELNAGTHMLVANYSGDASFNPSSATANFTISKAATTVTASTPYPPVQYGMSSWIKAEVDTTSLGAAPTGWFNFFVDGIQVGTTYVGQSGTFNSTTSPPTYASGDGETVTTFLSVGTHTLSATYLGDTNYQSAASATINVNVTQAPTIVYVMDETPSPIILGQQATVAARVSRGTGSGAIPTGTITFYDGATAIPGTVSYTTIVGDFGASITYTPATAGSHTISASYSGDANYLSALSDGYSVVLTVQTPDFQVSSSGFLPEIAAPGQSAAGTVSLSQVAGFTGTVNLACAVRTSLSVSPQDMPTCSLNPASVTVGSSPASVSVTILTVAPSLGPPAPRSEPPAGRWPVALWVVLLALAAVAVGAGQRPAPEGRAHRRVGVALAAVLLAVALWASCGGGGVGGGGGGGGGNPGTPAGNYTVTVTGTSGSLIHSTNLALTVQ